MSCEAVQAISTHGFLSNEPLATWFVALVSAMAVLVAVWVPIRQDKKTRKQKRSSILAVAEAAHAHAKSIVEAVDASDFLTCIPSLRLYEAYDQSIIESVSRALKGVPLHELGSREGVLAMLQMTDQIVFLGKAVETFRAGPNKDPGSVEALASVGTDLQMRQHLFAQQFAILADNVRRHWKEIHQSYVTLKASVHE
jgi:hypothetical protein